MLWTFRKDNEQDIFHLANRDVSVFLITMQLVKHLNPCFISENQSGILKADAMFSPIDFILFVIPFDKTTIDFFYHTSSITQSITICNNKQGTGF